MTLSVLFNRVLGIEADREDAVESVLRRWPGLLTPGLPPILTQVQWRGGFDPARFGSGGPVVDFTVGFYASTASDTQPDVINPPLVQYQTGGNAGQTLAGTFGSVPMYDYTYTLPASFQATANTKYWVYIVASQQGIPDWGLTVGTGGNGAHYRRIHNVGNVYQSAPGDTAFTLLGPVAPIGDLSATNNSPTALGRTTTFIATANAGSGISYTWNFGDDVLGNGRTITHTYIGVGNYTAVVTASNSLNALTATTTVTVFAPRYIFLPMVLKQ